MSKIVNKTGWWKVNFDIKLFDHSKDKREVEEGVRFEDLSETTQEHILKCIADGCFQGEVVEDYEIEEEDDI
ncbi:MAG: hypothetical protein LBC76_08020 [Treponema sp.]|nr:hypothetical protein [Treponema sp.]